MSTNSTRAFLTDQNGMMCDELTRILAHEVEELEKQVEKLKTALKEAIEFADEGWSYADDYFKKKWGYEETKEKLKITLNT
jgi:archaellum component FlaC